MRSRAADHGAGPRRHDQGRRGAGEGLLRQRHRLQPNADDDFNVRNMEEVFAAQESSAEVMSILLASIASVSLIVGASGS